MLRGPPQCNRYAHILGSSLPAEIKRHPSQMRMAVSVCMTISAHSHQPDTYQNKDREMDTPSSCCVCLQVQNRADSGLDHILHDYILSLCLRNSEAAWTVYFYFPVSHGHPDAAGSTACYVHCRWRTVALQLDPFLYI